MNSNDGHVFCGPAAFVFFILCSAMAHGQVEVALSLAPAKALLYEQVEAKVILRNNTGGMLAFDAASGSSRFFFQVERGRDETVKPANRSPLFFETSLLPGEARTNIVELTALYGLRSRGSYKVRACVERNDVLFVSPFMDLEIMKGFELARVINGIPGDPGAVRTYILEYFAKHEGEYVYLRIEDDQSRTVFGMHNLGRVIRVRHPEIKVDEAGNVHVLFQTQPLVFVHTAFTPYGVQLFSRTYMDRTGAISLQSTTSGQISVSQAAAASTNLTEMPGENSTQQTPGAKPKLGRGGLFGPK